MMNSLQMFHKLLFLVTLLAGIAASATVDNLRKESTSTDIDLSATKELLRQLSSVPSLDEQRDLSSATMMDFSAFSAGDVVTDLGGGITVVAMKKTENSTLFVPATAMVFDSANPTGGDFDLGSPNKAFGGPGVGNAGGKKKGLYANKVPQGNVLIVSEDDDETNPDDNKYGGKLKFMFSPPRYINSIGLLDNDEGAIFSVTTSDGGTSALHDYSGGDNSYEDVPIGKPSVKELSVEFIGSGSITKIAFEKTSCPLKPVTNFTMKVAGDVVSDLGNGASVAAFDSDGKPTEAMIFDSSAPTGEDFDLGSPNKSFGGPGVGKAGKKGRLFPNAVAKGKILIVSEEGSTSANPDDSAAGGYLVFNFAKPTFIESVGLLDNDEQTLFTLTSTDGSISHFYDSNGGDNSFELVKVSKPAVIQLTVAFVGSGSITEVNTCA